MYDPDEMYPQGYHPAQIDRSADFRGRAKGYTRTQRPPRYYLIDFGLSRFYNSRNVLDEPLRGGDRSAPEHRDGRRCNPFHTDIYYLGNLVRQEFILKYEGFEFMEDLANEMTHPNPARRPLIEDVMAKLARIRESLSGFKLRSTITSRRDPVIVAAYRRSRQAFHTIQYIISNKPAIPEPC